MTTSGNKPVRVAVVIPSHWDYRMGGAQYQAKLLIERLAKRHDVEVAWFASRARGLSFPDHEVHALDERPALRRYGHAAIHAWRVGAFFFSSILHISSWGCRHCNISFNVSIFRSI